MTTKANWRAEAPINPRSGIVALPERWHHTISRLCALMVAENGCEQDWIERLEYAREVAAEAAVA